MYCCNLIRKLIAISLNNLAEIKSGGCFALQKSGLCSCRRLTLPRAVGAASALLLPSASLLLVRFCRSILKSSRQQGLQPHFQFCFFAYIRICDFWTDFHITFVFSILFKIVTFPRVLWWGSTWVSIENQIQSMDGSCHHGWPADRARPCLLGEA